MMNDLVAGPSDLEEKTFRPLRQFGHRPAAARDLASGRRNPSLTQDNINAARDAIGEAALLLSERRGGDGAAISAAMKLLDVAAFELVGIHAASAKNQESA